MRRIGPKSPKIWKCFCFLSGLFSDTHTRREVVGETPLAFLYFGVCGHVDARTVGASLLPATHLCLFGSRIIPTSRMSNTASRSGRAKQALASSDISASLTSHFLISEPCELLLYGTTLATCDPSTCFILLHTRLVLIPPPSRGE
jgi:hypothetical protein